MEVIIAYKCEFCKKHYLRKSSAVRHEKRCYLNPSTKSCLTCGNFCRYSETIYVRPMNGEPYGSSDYDVAVIYCRKTNKSFGAKEYSKRQEFRQDCPHWVRTQCGRNCDNCDRLDCWSEAE